jgi:hypothetical protein
MPDRTIHPEFLFTSEQKEAAFREGFQRGYASALGDLNLLIKHRLDCQQAISKCLEFVRTRLDQWRKNNLDVKIPPPGIQ